MIHCVRGRKLAVLPDNDLLLRRSLARIQKELSAFLEGKVAAGLVIGSVAEGIARDGSDIDLVLILQEGTPRRGHYQFWDRKVASRVAKLPFPVQPIFLARESLRTTEPNLRAAIRKGIVLWDHAGLFSKRRQWSTAS